MNIAITFETVCAGGGHVTVGVVVDGGAKKLFTVEADEIRAAIDNRDQLVLGLIRLSLSGLTRAQARTKLQSGLSITL